MQATFEEKTYESYFNTELNEQTTIYFPLGQVQEGSLGFDVSAFSRSRALWRHLGHPFWFFHPFHGVALREIADEMEHFLGVVINDMPTIKANLLFQYKRPTFISSPSGTEWRHWNEPYYRYDIYQRQQDLLSQIDAAFSDRLLILYAAPAVHNVNDLVNLKINRAIISNSNFRRSADLSGHLRNTYTRAGNFSIACSDPERLENFNLISLLDGLSSSNDDRSRDENNRQIIINFRKQIVVSTYQNTFYGNSFQKLNYDLPKLEEFELLYSFMVMSNFRLLTGNQWLIKL